MTAKPGVVDLFVNFARNLRERGLEYVSGRYYGKYAGEVVDNDDPQGQGRVLVTCKLATGREDELALWAYPSAEYAGRNKGVYFPPDIGDVVWVWFDHGDPTQPRFSGAYWGNTAFVKTKATSEVPSEFRKLTPGPITTRGVKTKEGLGFLIEDDNTTPLGRRFELWTGHQPAGDPDGDAVRHHQITMSDLTGDEFVEVASNLGNVSQWIDVAGQVAIRNVTVNGLFVNLLDFIQKIVMGGPLGFKFTIDEGTGKQIEAKTPLGLFARLLETAQRIESGGPKGFSIAIDETTGNITITTPGGRIVKLDDTGANITITDGQNTATINPAGVTVQSVALVNIIAAAALELSAGAAATLTAAGAMAITAAGISINSSGGGPMVTNATGISTNTFTGLVTEAFQGALNQIITGLWNVIAGVVNIEAPTVNLGSGGTKFALIDVRLLPLFNGHVHLSTLVGTPTSPPVTPIAPGVANTTATQAN